MEMINMTSDALLTQIKESIDDLTDAYVSYQDQYAYARLITDSAASDTWEKVVFKAPFNCTVKDVWIIPDGNIGQATNYMTLDVQNKGASGSGTTSIGSRVVNSTNTVSVAVGVDVVSVDATVTDGYCLTVKKTVTSAGQAFPGGLVVVRYSKA
jgi:hypothetical protein